MDRFSHHTDTLDLIFLTVSFLNFTFFPSRGAVGGDRHLSVELAPTQDPSTFLGRAGKPPKSREEIPQSGFTPAR